MCDYMSPPLTHVEKLSAVFEKVHLDLKTELGLDCNSVSSIILTPSIRASLESVSTILTPDLTSSFESIDSLLSNIVISDDLTFASACESLSTNEDQSVVRRYMLLLLFIASVYQTIVKNEGKKHEKCCNKLVEWSLEVTAGKDTELLMPDISVFIQEDTTIRCIYNALVFARKEVAGYTGQEEPSTTTKDKKSEEDAFAGLFENTAMGSIAREVAGELDLSKLANISSIQDLLNPGQNGDVMNVIADIVGKVGTKLQSRISSGQVNQQTLMQEAMNVLGPTMSSLMQNMPNNNTRRNTTARDRLRSKLNNR